MTILSTKRHVDVVTGDTVSTMLMSTTQSLVEALRGFVSDFSASKSITRDACALTCLKVNSDAFVRKELPWWSPSTHSARECARIQASYQAGGRKTPQNTIETAPQTTLHPIHHLAHFGCSRNNLEADQYVNGKVEETRRMI
jgi:hypothetical protein